MLKSAIVAAKKKNNLNEVVYLVGNEDELTSVATVATKRTISKRLEQVEPVKPRVERTQSIKATLSQIDTIGRTTNSAGEELSETSTQKDSGIVRNDFTQTDVDNRWSVFVERLKKKDLRMYAALNPVQPKLLENFEIEISLQNNSQLEEFQSRLRPLLISELREELKNDSIEITGKVTDSEKLERPNFLSENEKLQKMIEKNPALQQLRSKFKLDFE